MLPRSLACTPQSIRICLSPLAVDTVRRKKSPKPTRNMRTRNPFTLWLEDAGGGEDACCGEVATIPGFWRAVLAALFAALFAALGTPGFAFVATFRFAGFFAAAIFKPRRATGQN